MTSVRSLSQNRGFPFFRKEAKGFTLVELMVAISIVVILATIGLTIFSQAQIAARDSKRIGDMEETQKALEQFYAINRNFISITATSVNNANVSGLTNGTTGNLGPYYQNSTPPSDPNTALNGGTEYKYYSCGAPATQYTICARMENCTGKCNQAPGSVTDGCSQVGSFGSVAAAKSLYCLKSLSN